MPILNAQMSAKLRIVGIADEDETRRNSQSPSKLPLGPITMCLPEHPPRTKFNVFNVSMDEVSAQYF